jgi:RNA polymerase sigma-70 factor (ECF subfamily)
MAVPDDDAAQWLSAARAGSSEAMGQILEACRGYLLLIAQQEIQPDLRAKAGASDLVQQTLLSALGDFDRFQGNSEAEILAWLRQLLLHNLTDFARLYRATDKRQISREVALDTGNPAAQRAANVGSDASPSGEVIAREEARQVQQALERLPEDYRRVLVLRFQEDRSFEEIGRLMNLSANAARKLWLRAIKRMQQESQGPP